MKDILRNHAQEQVSPAVHRVDSSGQKPPDKTCPKGTARPASGQAVPKVACQNPPPAEGPAATKPAVTGSEAAAQRSASPYRGKPPDKSAAPAAHMSGTSAVLNGTPPNGKAANGQALNSPLINAKLRITPKSQDGNLSHNISAGKKVTSGHSSSHSPNDDTATDTAKVIPLDATSATRKPPSTPIPASRLYWVPPEIPWESLPADLQVALTEIVGPCHDTLVVGEREPLAKAVGLTLVTLLTVEVLTQFELGEEFLGKLPGAPADAKVRDKLIEKYLRLAGAKLKAANFLMRLKVLRAQLRQDGALGILGATP
jgi:hypothetical protein